MPAQRADGATLEAYLLKHEGRYLPGYGWVFPLGNGRFNIGVGHLISYRRWRDINAKSLLDQFLRQLPAEWELPELSRLSQEKAVQAWRLPMGVVTRPPWQPGLIFTGDAAGLAKAAGGAGISRALQSGIVAADVAVEALGSGTPSNLEKYDQELRRLWSKTDRRSRALLQFARSPRTMEIGLKSLDHPLGRRRTLRAFYKDMDYQDIDTAKSLV
jgi:flavin-dependent dehydrogenase